MEKFFSQFQFNDLELECCLLCCMIIWMESFFCPGTLVFSANEEGSYLWKLTFEEEPYQAIKFASKEDCYKYLSTNMPDFKWWTG